MKDMDKELPLPPLYRIRQALDTAEISEVGFAVAAALAQERLAERVRPGMKVAITVGSRGIDRILEVTRAVVEWLREQGADPFIVAAMGSHGGSTPEGRKAVLKQLGISEESAGAPILSGGETVVLGHVGNQPIYCSAAAATADGIVVVNRIKPHTSYTGRYESGLSKMLVVGLGLEWGASVLHSRGVRQIPRLVEEMAPVALRSLPVLFGLALIENGLDRLKRIEAIPAEKIPEREPKLLQEAKALVARLPFAEAEVLVVDYLGKDISGTGMDTSVIGRLHIAGEPEPESPRIKRLVALRLSPRSQGSAYGIGLADLTTEALIRAMDPMATRANALASTFIERAKVPLAFPTDKKAIQAGVATCGHPDLASLRIARIRNTLHLSELLVSEPLLKNLDLPAKTLEGPLDWPFDLDGNLSDLR